ncbi:MAG: DUF362 domain-containing protein [Chloroflexi bacterium]|nr:DUF362 domain-containing protein [Chloroflexota bacterium]
MSHDEKHSKPQLSRRTLLKTAGLAVTGGLLSPKNARAENPSGGLSTLPRRAGIPPRVAIGRADSYDEALIRERVFTMIEQLGGLDDVVKPGDSVAIKTNLTGGVSFERVLNAPATESYITHPSVVRALVEAVQAAGAGDVFIVESVFDNMSFSLWGYEEIADDLGVTLVDLNSADPFDDFVEQPVGPDWMIYEKFKINPLLRDVDVFMSVAKLKCHATAGITLSMKNLVGMVPMAFYRMSDQDGNRSALHGPDHQGITRIPSVVTDLVRARPIHFSLIDGVMTSEGSEGPWNGDRNWHPKVANVLVAGKNMVATDAVGAAVMGFDPMAASFLEEPFNFCLNHLQLAATLGLGTNDLSAIEVVGEPLDSVKVKFRGFRPDKIGQSVIPFGGRI